MSSPSVALDVLKATPRLSLPGHLVEQSQNDADVHAALT
jgi:hypothetical protein